MEAIIRTNNKNAFNSLIHFLKSLHFDVEMIRMKKSAKASRKPLNTWALKNISGISEPEFAKIWDNESDAVYDRYL